MSRKQKATKNVNLARALSKRGYCSRSESEKLVRAGRVSVNDEIQRDPSWRVDPKHDRIHVNGTPVKAEPKIYLMLNKPRGLITTASDEQRRDTVYDCLANANLPHVFPVGRLDKASEGLLLFTNDTQWANAITNPATHLDKVYHVQVDCLADEALVQRLLAGTQDGDDFLQAKDAHLLRMGTRNSWLEIVLDEGKNRHIRRLLVAQGVSVLRLVRVAIGPLVLGDLEKGKYRYLTQTEVKTLSNHTKFDSYSALE